MDPNKPNKTLKTKSILSKKLLLDSCRYFKSAKRDLIEFRIRHSFNSFKWASLETSRQTSTAFKTSPRYHPFDIFFIRSNFAFGLSAGAHCLPQPLLQFVLCARSRVAPAPSRDGKSGDVGKTDSNRRHPGVAPPGTIGDTTQSGDLHAATRPVRVPFPKQRCDAS